MNHRPLLVSAHLASPLAHHPPHLDALLEWSVSIHVLHFDKQPTANGAISPWKVDRALPAPPVGVLPIYVARKQLGPWPVALCSAPILSPTAAETVEHIGKRIATEEAGLLAERERRVVSTTNSWTKSYRLPLRVRAAALVCWFCVGNRREILKLLKRVNSLSKKRSVGYGRVSKWEAVEVESDCSWFAPHENGQVLMRVLPQGPWLPADLVGYRKDYGSCCPPYWHPERHCEVVTPC